MPYVQALVGRIPNTRPQVPLLPTNAIYQMPHPGLDVVQEYDKLPACRLVLLYVSAPR
jgi:hypothetical protein